MTWLREFVGTIKSAGLDFRTPSLENIFSRIYSHNGWANEESVSGRGSTLARTEVVRRELLPLLAGIGANSLLDAACGDFNWMRQTDLGIIKYVGVDIVPQLIVRHRETYADSQHKFLALDITRDDLPAADAILCRDCFIHLSFNHSRSAIQNFKRSGSTFLLATTHATVTENIDVESGGWRSLNLRLPPYDFPEPLRMLIENAESGKALGVWRIRDL